MSIPNYLLFPLEDHHSSTFVPSGQEFSCWVELNCGYDVSWKRGIEDDIIELQEFPFNNLHWDNEIYMYMYMYMYIYIYIYIYKIIKRNTEKLNTNFKKINKQTKKHINK